MAHKGLQHFVDELRENDDLLVIDEFVDPVLEMAEIADRFVKSGGKAILFTNNGTSFPVLINMFASDSRMTMALGRNSLDDAGQEIEKVFRQLSAPAGSFLDKIQMIPGLSKIASYIPSKMRKRGSCQENIIRKELINLNNNIQ